MRVLHVIADPMPVEEALDRQLAEAFLKSLREASPETTVTELDLYASRPPFFDYNTYRNLWYPLGKPDYEPTPEEKAAGAYSLEQARLFNDTDILALSAPMWNYSMPAIMKAWIDQLLCPNQTFKFGPEGPEPLHHVKKVLLFTSSGAAYKDDDPRDCLARLVRAAFGFLGINDCDVVWADGQNKAVYADAAERRQKALAHAEALGREMAGG